MNFKSRIPCCVRPFHLNSFSVAVVWAIFVPITFSSDSGFQQHLAGAEKGKIPQEIELAADYFIGRGVPQDLKMAAHWYQKAAEQGDPRAQDEVGYFYQLGIGVSQNPERAFHWYQLSSASGFVKGKVHLGVCYLWGIGVRKDKVVAVQLLHEAVNRGSGVAATYLGDQYYLGTGLDRNKAAAQHWYEVGHKLRDPVATFDLGVLYFKVGDHPRDMVKAVKLLREAAAAGYVPSMYKLGFLLIQHPELAKSPQEARTSLEAAANAGSWKASVTLGILARDGAGVPVEPAEAYYRFQVAILQGGEVAKRFVAPELIKLSAKLTPEQTSELTSRANSWFHERPVKLDSLYHGSGNWWQFPAWGSATEDDGLHSGQLLPSPPG